MGSKVTQRNPNALRKYIRRVQVLENQLVKVGHDVALGTPPDVVAIAAINALGGNRGDNPPPRPVLEPMLEAEKNSLRGFSTKAVALANRGKDPTPVLQAQADFLLRRFRQAIRDMHAPPNAPSTVEAKGFDDPLIGKGSDGGRILAGARAGVVPRRRR